MPRSTMPRLEKITLGVSPITERVYLGTIKSDNGEYAEWGEKRDATHDFCRALLEWCPDGYEREITSSDGTAYRVTVEQIETEPKAA